MAKRPPLRTVLKGTDTGRLDRAEVRRVIAEVRELARQGKLEAEIAPRSRLQQAVDKALAQTAVPKR